MNDKNQSSNKIVKESIIIFEKVNHKIYNLIECSVKDFELLNTNFKKYYNKLLLISDTSKNFISLLLELNSDELFLELQTQKEISELKLNETISAYLVDIKKINERLNYYLLLLNNLNQDLSTVRLLFTNLNFDPLITINLSSANRHIKSIGQCLNKLENSISELYQLLIEAIKFTDEGFINTLDQFSEQFENIKDSYGHIAQLGKMTSKQHKSIIELEEKRLSNTSDIITNLQFQDILRQKIEHVQKAHEEIISDLKKAHIENSELKPEEYFKIRDITTLQSAQLIHSNQEYQSAVETILHKINELNTLLNKYQVIWNHFCKPENAKLQALNSRLGEQIKTLNSQCVSLTHITDKFDSMLQNLSVQQKTLYENIGQEGQICGSFSELKKQFSKIEKQFSNSEKHSALKQIKSELEKFEIGFLKLSAELQKHNETFKNDQNISKPGFEKDVELIKNFSEKNSNYFNNYLNNKIGNLFKENAKFESSTAFNIKQVTYYKNFEKEINDIISLLDNLLSKINVSKNDIDFDQLEYLRNMYTMDSERNIHDLITGKRRTNDKEGQQDRDNEVEFF